MPLDVRNKAVEAIKAKRICAIIRTADESSARAAARAAVEGAFRLLEITLTTPGALGLIDEFRQDRELTVGAGTVMSVEMLKEAVAAGAEFIVSPICDPKIVAAAATQGVACIPGAFTPTELEAAHRLGADFAKLFPAPPGGVSYVESLRGPLPHLRLFPTAGITADNFLDYLSAGCAGVGFGRTLFDPSNMAAGRFDEIRRRALGITGRFSTWRQSSP